ncbi:mechanosensitive ion channel family protein [Proteiniphilum sp. UBA5384]|uniref:mechanosensitive ion channel family protein n=1 Tax=Proteiniphilum sp. UBA5384 TaxID=1947279 RepID=UPI0025DE91AF|nr:mechanosensitive ion channel family protein [Proteiniphilum sp. UBA5384]
MKLITFILSIFLPVVAVNAQSDTTQVIQADSLRAISKDSLIAVNPQADTLKVIDNSSTIELIVSSTQENQTSSMKEELLNEQLEALQSSDLRQRRLIEKQLNELRKTDSIRRVAQREQIDSMKRQAAGAPVVLKGDTLYLIYTNLGSFSPNERAASNSEKIFRAAKMFSLKSDSLIVVESGSTSDILYRETILSSITDMDALWMDTPRNALAEAYKEKIIEAIGVYKKSISLLNILKMSGLSLFVILILFGAVKGVGLLFRRVIDKKLVSKKDKWFPGIRIRNLEVMDSDREVKVALFVSKIIRYLIYIILFYLAIPLLFSIFPQTQRLAETLFGWIFSPLASTWKGFVLYLPNLFKIIVIVLIMRYVVRFFRYIFREISAEKLIIPGFYADWAKATFNILRIFLYAFMLILIFPLLPGSDSGVFQGVSVFMGVIFTLGSTSVIGNLVAGMVITYMRPFIIGDRIKIGDVTGDVTEKSPFVVRIRTTKNEIVTVPNSTILSSNVINYSSTSTGQNEGLIVNTSVTMGYEVPWRQVNQLLIDAALKTDLLLSKPQPFVLQTALNDFAASYQLNAYTKNPEKQAVIYSQLHQNIQDIFREAGIELITPHYRATRDGNKSVVPPEVEKSIPL